MLEDHDLPVDVGVIDRLIDRSEGDVLGDEVAHVALGVVPIRKAGELSLRLAHVINVLPELFRLAQLNGEILDDLKLVEIDRAQRVDIVRAGKLERTRIGEDFQSVGSMR